jgi:hypothetical protein
MERDDKLPTETFGDIPTQLNPARVIMYTQTST